MCSLFYLAIYTSASMSIERISNVIIKIMIFSAKSLTIFYLAKVLNEDLFGILGLIYAITVYYIYIAGMELHTLANREFISSTDQGKVNILSNLFSYHAASSVVGYFVLFELLKYMGIVKLTSEIIIISLVIVTEHLGLEVYRLLIASEEQLIASYTSLVRVVWIFIIIFIDFAFEKVEFIQVVGFWLAFNLISIFLGLVYLLKNLNIKFKISRPDLGWIKKKFIKSIPFLVAALSLGGLSSIDRIIISSNYGLKTLAGYVFYLSVVNAIFSLVEAAVYVYAYPKLILNQKNRNRFNEIYKKMWVESLCLVLILIALSYLILPSVLMVIGKETYVTYAYIFNIFIFLAMLKIINSNFQYCLYALKMDKVLYVSNIMMTPVFVASYYFMKEYFYLDAILYSIMIAYALNGLYKFYFISKNNNRHLSIV